MACCFLLLMLKCGDKQTINSLPIGASLVLPSLSHNQTGKSAIIRWSEFIKPEYSDPGIMTFSVHTRVVKTTMERRIPEEIYGILTDTLEISLPTWRLKGRYPSYTRDVSKLFVMKDETV